MRGLVIGAVLACASTAHAGRTPYGWLYGAEVQPEGQVEAQAIVAEQNGKDPNHVRDTTWWTGITFGATDNLELALPFEFEWQKTDATPPFNGMKSYGIEARYRFVTSDPEHAPAFVPLVRVAIKRDIIVRDSLRTEADVVGSYTSGRVNALVDVGYVGVFTRDDHHLELRPGAGVSIDVKSGLRLGAEVYSELSLDDQRKSFVAAGPNLAYSKGRIWISAAYGIGVYQIKDAPRFSWGVAF